jgi:hypothetical protein
MVEMKGFVQPVVFEQAPEHIRTDVLYSITSKEQPGRSYEHFVNIEVLKEQTANTFVALCPSFRVD